VIDYLIEDCTVCVESYIEKFHEWFKEEVRIKELDDFCEITVPFYDHRNQFLRIFMTRIDNDFILTDKGKTLSLLLESELLQFKKSKLVSAFKPTLRRFGVRVLKGELVVKACYDDFFLKLHNLIQVMIFVEQFNSFLYVHSFLLREGKDNRNEKSNIIEIDFKKPDSV
jgi:hypothetical protein